MPLRSFPQVRGVEVAGRGEGVCELGSDHDRPDGTPWTELDGDIGFFRGSLPCGPLLGGN